MIPSGYREEVREFYPLMVWCGRHMWWMVRLVGRINPEWAHNLSIEVLARWPRIRCRILVKDGH